MRKITSIIFMLFMAIALSACGERVEVPPAHVGKIQTKDGYREGLVGTSKFRLDACWAYCDKLVLLNVADQANIEPLEIFMPQDKLTLKVTIRTNLTITDKKDTEVLFNSIAPDKSDNETISLISRESIYKTYAQQIILTETREYLSKFTIAEVASSMEKVNAELSERLAKSIKERTPFSVRYVGITNIEYPPIITEAQENAARRREEIQQEEAKLEVSRVQLERELQEAQLQRRIDVEKAEADAEADRIRAIAANNPAVIKLRELENQRAWIDAWSKGGAQVPTTIIGSDGKSSNNFLLQVPTNTGGK